jgi:hypothetical protein
MLAPARLILAAIAAVIASVAQAQVEAFHFDAKRVPVGQAFHYVKTNRDGTHAARVSLYVAAVDRLESLKWDEGGTRATLVVAHMDWTRLSVGKFESWVLERGQPPALKAQLEQSADGREMRLSLGEQRTRIGHWPWHSYDFDFASLSLSMPHLVDAEGSFGFWRTDFVYSDPPAFAELGEVRLQFEGREMRGGVPVRRYRIGGEGLEGNSGHWWSDAITGTLFEFELPIPDEPGFRDVRFTLRQAEEMTAASWAAFKREKTGE